ncbi:MAG TPA: prepilin peptidase [Xanthobacteraceae bacterium]|nr:prepilin peptidase [Xanthobacteraceae bacterium]
MLTEATALTVFPAMMAFAALSDLFTMTIANRVSLILVGGFGVLAVMAGMSVADMAAHAGAAIAVLIVAFACFACGWIGGGDAKLAAAAVLWLGFAHLADYLLYASLLGGALTVLLMQFRAVPLPAVLAGREWVERLHRRDGGIPYGIALAAAALLIYPQTEWLKAAGV